MIDWHRDRLRSDGSNEIQQLRWNSSLGRVDSPESLKN
jgi:hypothetical protein